MVDYRRCKKILAKNSYAEMNKNICPLSDSYYSKCLVMRTYYYLVEEYFAAWSWSG